MATVTITIPDDKISRVRDAFALEYLWASDLGVTKAEFARQQIIRYIKQTVKNSEGSAASSSARITAENDVDNIDIT